MAHVLIVDDDAKICLFLSELLTEMNHSFQVANSVHEAKSLFTSQTFDLVLLDLELPDGNGLDLLPSFIDSQDPPEVIIITGTGDARGAELAFKYGAWDYVQKPFLLNEISLPITRAVQYRKEKLSVAKVIPLIRPDILGESAAMYQCLAEVGKAAQTDASVLITGETGTGKELFARAIHQNSKRGKAPFIAIDCGALPETLLESTLFGHEKGSFTGASDKQDGLLVQANGGTLMLDEIGDLPLPAQKSFLRSLQERIVRPIGGAKEIPIDIRLIAATNLDLDNLVEQGLFRQDLLYRVRAMQIELPPLKDRKDDIEIIVIQKIHELSVRYGLEVKAVSPEFLKVLQANSWPGNVRELLNVLEYALASAAIDSTLYPKHLPPEYRISRLTFERSPDSDPSTESNLFDDTGEFMSFHAYRTNTEKYYLEQLLSHAQGDRKEACHLSGISQSRLYGLLKKHKLPRFSAG